MVDDVGREDHRGAIVRQFADHNLELALVDRIEPAEGLVEHDQTRAVDQRAKQLHRLRHAFRQLADLPVDRMAKALSEIEALSSVMAPPVSMPVLVGDLEG